MSENKLNFKTNYQGYQCENCGRSLMKQTARASADRGELVDSNTVKNCLICTQYGKFTDGKHERDIGVSDARFKSIFE